MEEDTDEGNVRLLAAMKFFGFSVTKTHEERGRAYAKAKVSLGDSEDGKLLADMIVDREVIPVPPRCSEMSSDLHHYWRTVYGFGAAFARLDPDTSPRVIQRLQELARGFEGKTGRKVLGILPEHAPVYRFVFQANANLSRSEILRDLDEFKRTVKTLWEKSEGERGRLTLDYIRNAQGQPIKPFAQWSRCLRVYRGYVAILNTCKGETPDHGTLIQLAKDLEYWKQPTMSEDGEETGSHADSNALKQLDRDIRRAVELVHAAKTVAAPFNGDNSFTF